MHLRHKNRASRLRMFALTEPRLVCLSVCLSGCTQRTTSDSKVLPLALTDSWLPQIFIQRKREYESARVSSHCPNLGLFLEEGSKRRIADDGSLWSIIRNTEEELKHSPKQRARLFLVYSLLKSLYWTGRMYGTRGILWFGLFPVYGTRMFSCTNCNLTTNTIIVVQS